MTGGKKLLLGVVVLALIIIAVVALIPRGPTVTETESGTVVVQEPVPGNAEDLVAFERRKAASACRVAILQSLKDPSTAQFVDELDVTPWVAEDGGDYSFKIAVRARNETGLVTRPFVCRAHPETAGWSIAKLTEGEGR